MSQQRPHRDVRMRGFTSRTTVQAALAWIDEHTAPLEAEETSLSQAAGRALARDVSSTVDVPNFTRSMMDGYAVEASSIQGATAYHALELEVIGESLPGKPFLQRVTAGEAVRIMTGAAMPLGADAVLPAERAEVLGQKLRVLDDVSPGKNVSHRGEDVTAGDVVLKAGRVLRPQDLGLLASIGQGRVLTVRNPQVQLVITGNELLPAGSQPEPGRTIDANGPMLAALIARDGGRFSFPGGGSASNLLTTQPLATDYSRSANAAAASYLVSDDPAAILSALRAPADITIVTGGSSVGQEDYAPALLAQHGQLAIHGVAMRPSSPTGMGLLDGRLVFLLPGNPVSCLCAYDFFAGRAIRRLGGHASDWPYRKQRLRLTRKLVSQVGRVDYSRVRVASGQAEPISIGGASILSSTTTADGFVIVVADSEGYPAGAEVEVFLYD